VTLYGVRLIFKKGSRMKGLGVIFGAFILLAVIVGAVGPAPSTAVRTTPAIDADARAKDKASRTVAKYSDITLEDYAKLSQKKRAALTSAYVVSAGIDHNAAPDFVACMGDFAWQKSKDLPASQVFGWCKGEHERGDAAFLGHVDELSAKDLGSQATVICRDLVREQLTAPGSADFPWVPEFSVRMPRQKYRIKSYVDATNVLGGEVRLRYFCEVQYNGSGEPLSPVNWSAQSFEMSAN
jgi:hypothetical protein